MGNFKELFSQGRALAHIEARKMLDNDVPVENVIAYLRRNGDTRKQARNVIIAYDRKYYPDLEPRILPDPEPPQKQREKSSQRSKPTKTTQTIGPDVKKSNGARNIILIVAGITALVGAFGLSYNFSSSSDLGSGSSSRSIDDPQSGIDTQFPNQFCLMFKDGEKLEQKLEKTFNKSKSELAPLTASVRQSLFKPEQDLIGPNLLEYDNGLQNGKISEGCENL